MIKAHYIAPAGFLGTGLHIGGGWQGLVPTTAGPALAMPADGSWQALEGLGFVADPNAETLPVAVASDGFPDPLPDPQA